MVAAGAVVGEAAPELAEEAHAVAVVGAETLVAVEAAVLHERLRCPAVEEASGPAQAAIDLERARA